MHRLIDIKRIVPSPFQVRKHRDEEKLKELAASIMRDGMIAPVVLRCNGRNGTFQNIAGSRRVEAVRKYTDIKAVPALIMDVDDLEARRISGAENFQREDLSAVETVEAIVAMVDEELIKDKEYASMGKKPAERVKALLGKLDSMRRSKERGYKAGKATKQTSNKFIGRVEKIFENLPKPMEWLSFLNNDLPLVIDFCKEVQKVSIQNDLNGAQTRALQKLKTVSKKEFKRLMDRNKRPPNSDRGHFDGDPSRTKLREMSAREIESIADRVVKQETRKEQKLNRVSPSLDLETKIYMMCRWGIPANRIAARLGVNRLTALKYAANPGLLRSTRSVLRKGHSIKQVSKELGLPEPLVWSVALEGKTDQERFESLGWGLRTWDNWSFNDVDQRFGDDWPGQIPAQLVGHALFYFTREGDLVFDPMAGGGVVADTCLAFQRKCWSFDLVDRPEARPEIEPHRWDPKKLLWPVNGKEKPDLIFFDPPYFSKMADQYEKESVSVLSRKDYLKFLRNLFPLFREHAKPNARLAFLNADWGEFQRVSALEEDPDQSILLCDYMDIMRRSGWKITHLIDCPLSSQRFKPNQVRRMQKNRILGLIRRSLIIGRKI